jgi:hypothetical protein
MRIIKFLLNTFALRSLGERTAKVCRKDEGTIAKGNIYKNENT